MDNTFHRFLGITLCFALLLAVASPTAAAIFDKNDFRLSGFVRQYASMNLEDQPETRADDQGDLSMLRTSLYLESNMSFTDYLEVTAIGRVDEEVSTDYIQHLENGPFTATSPAAIFGGAGAANLQDEYENTEIRELYADITLTERMDLRLGKQQIVWGKTDFFQALDVIHGFNFRWRNFLAAQEQNRKPLSMANLKISLPEFNGDLQLVYRPGIDDEEQIGNSFDIRGGRWALQPNRGLDFEAPLPAGGATPENFNSPLANHEEESFGVRWTGLAFNNNVEYSLVYWHGHQQDPVVNSAANPFKGVMPANGFAEFIYPQVDVAGGSFNYYSRALDVVMRGELAYTFDNHFNVGSAFGIPGYGGIVQRDAVKMMMNFDKTIDAAQWLLAADRPGFLSVQIFNQWIPAYEASDNIVDLAGYAAPQEEHQETLATAIFSWNYFSDTLNPTVALISDVGNGGDMEYIGRLQYVHGNNWRARLELNIFDPQDFTRLNGTGSAETHVLGYFENADQLELEVTYQF